ncbi:MAG: hypothetical protein R2845_07825 [Thermomicrobiales bacterium]
MQRLLVWWIVFIVILQLAGVASRVARVPPGLLIRGWAFARITSLLIAGWIVWILSSIEWISFRAIWIWLALAVLALLWFASGPGMRIT